MARPRWEGGHSLTKQRNVIRKMSERKQVRKPFFVASVIVTVLLFSAAVSVMAISRTATIEIPTYENASVMTAEGIFDRVELVDRHFGDWNGQEVEGSVLAVLYENGSIEISRDHYEARPNYWNGTNYPFFLYIYDAVDHLRERVSVECGVPEDFVFLNVTITVSLDTIVGTKAVQSQTEIILAGILVALGIGAFYIAATTSRKHWVNI